MSDFLRQFARSLQDQDQTTAAAPAISAGGTSDAKDDTKTDDSKLVAPGTVYVSPDGGTTDEPFPEPEVEYDFCANVVNAGKLPSGPFSVLFKLSGDRDWEMSFAQDAGLKAGASVLAVVHFGTFPNKFANYDLTACVYADSAPDAPISCAGSFGIVVNTK